MDPNESARMVADHIREIAKQFVGQSAIHEVHENIRKAVDSINHLVGPISGDIEHIEFKTIGDSISITPKTEHGKKIVREMMEQITVQEVHES